MPTVIIMIHKRELIVPQGVQCLANLNGVVIAYIPKEEVAAMKYYPGIKKIIIDKKLRKLFKQQ